MQMLLATHVLRGYPNGRGPGADPSSRRNLLAWIRHSGFDGIEVGSWWLDFGMENRRVLEEVREDAEAHGVVLGALNALRKNVTHPAVAEENRAYLLRSVEAAAILGAPYLSISLSLAGSVVGVPDDRVRGTDTSPGSSRDATDEEFASAAAFLVRLAAAAAEKRVEVALELHHCSLADTSASLLRLLDAVDAPNLSANPDVGNAHWGYAVPAEPWYEAIDRVADRVRLWHVKNFQRIHIPEVDRAFFVHAPLETGDLDYRWALNRLIDAGFTGPISIEGAGPGDFLAFAARGKAYLQTLLAERAAGIGSVQ